MKKILKALDRMTDIILAYGPSKEKKKKKRDKGKEKKKEKLGCDFLKNPGKTIPPAK